MTAGNHRPHNTMAIDVEPAGREPVNRRIWIVPWQFVDFCKGGCRGIWPGVQPNDCARESQDRSPDRPIRWTHSDTVESGVDPLVLGGIDGLIRLDILIAFSVCIGVEDKCRPALRLLFIMGFLEHPRIQPTYRSSAATAACPQCIVAILGKH